MSRFRLFPFSTILLVVAPAFAQSVTPVAQPARPPAVTPATSPPAVTPATPTQRAHVPVRVPEQGPAQVPRPAAASPAQAAPRVTPAPVRDAQGRIVPGARETTPGRARDPATGQEFRTAPVVRPR